MSLLCDMLIWLYLLTMLSALLDEIIMSQFVQNVQILILGARREVIQMMHIPLLRTPLLQSQRRHLEIEADLKLNMCEYAFECSMPSPTC